MRIFVWINDGSPSSAHVHAHCLGNEQCACAYDLNKESHCWIAMHNKYQGSWNQTNETLS